MAGYARAHVMRDSLITFASEEFNAQATKARLVPDTPVQSMRTLVPDGQIQDVDSTIWTLELAGVQDYGTDGLAKYLNDNAGDKVTLVLQPKTGSAQDKATVTVIAMPVEFGGEQGAFRVFDTTLPVDGQPAFAQSA